MQRLAEPTQVHDNPKNLVSMTKGTRKKLARILAAPIITWPGYEKDFHMDNSIVKMVKPRRLEKFLKCYSEGKEYEFATDPEVAMYLSTCSFVAPMESDYCNIYIRAAAKLSTEMAEAITKMDSFTMNHPPDDMELIKDQKLRAWLVKTGIESLKDEKGKAKVALFERKIDGICNESLNFDLYAVEGRV